MFANFLYFIIALLVLTLYEPVESPPYSLLQALAMALALVSLFFIYTQKQFRRLEKSVAKYDIAYLDQRFTTLMTRHAMLALVVFALDIWALHLPSYLRQLSWFSLLPTLNALFFLALFIGYLVLIWFSAYDAQRAIYRSDITRKAYVYSNIAFSVPVLIPWLLLSGITDLLQILPFRWPNLILDNAFGQIGFFLVFLVIAAVFAPLLIQRFWRCRPLEPGFHRGRIEALCRHAGVKYADIVYWPIFGGRMITAGVMGLVGRFRYILVTETLLNVLRPSEIDQVIAHEIGHVRRRHLLLYLLFFAGFMLVWYAAFISSHYVLSYLLPYFLNLDIPPSLVKNGTLAVMLIGSAIVYFRYIFGYFMRNFERQADLFVFDLFPSAQPLIDTFDKIVLSSGQAADKPNWHHFSIQQRINYLRRCEQFPLWIKRHEVKVRRSIAIYLAASLLLGAGLYHHSRDFFSKEIYSLELNTIEKYLQRKQHLGSSDAFYFLLLGDYYAALKKYPRAFSAYEKGMALDPDLRMDPLVWLKTGNAYHEAGDPAKAADAWEQALAITPEDPAILNNLAWLLATTKAPEIKNAPRALKLAQKALDLKQASYIWDTYAEALYANGRFAEAVRAGEKALSGATNDADLYKKQLEKFRKALNASTTGTPPDV